MDVSEAERAVTSRHLRRVWALPATTLGRSGWPPSPGQRLHWHWNYWWQAHLLDTLVDAQLRAPSPARLSVIRSFVRSVRLRNFGRWTNDYYDDMAWLGLALQRVSALGIDVGPALAAIDTQLLSAWTPAAGGGIWWRKGDDFKNAPANGPAAIFHARSGNVARARAMLDWLSSTLVDPESGLVWDGIRADTGELVKHIFTYCQGVYLGACLELSSMDAAARTVRAVAEHCAPGGVIRGQGGGDGGLFAAILARYLALAARSLPGPEASTARSLVLTSAEACWSGAAPGPVFSAYWDRPAPWPLPADAPERDLSVQVGGWMLLEAAATL
ncbi:glycoside hydrolase family 76 protein [Amycolatopsis sp. SID8362]|uniref:glycoside hydrolase family 76 protein n=1 Tax=Amycolatopsis sp. SID8362 TaxID=2690346 RepID=UPI00136873C5|nr:glycoside hydrolase family 76 protein [Amycolatopsis sp. SID8362]NBH10623.1 fructose-bisphosphate aldolase [Amycolatopsis sp. SID8362]NED47317.1 fructose-bisphosphate aldolase [Amycolatopsis sp. SID8362]